MWDLVSCMQDGNCEGSSERFQSHHCPWHVQLCGPATRGLRVGIHCPPLWLTCNLSFLLSLQALTWKMALPQVAARWTLRPARPRGWSCTPPSPGTASAESPFSTDPTVTMTCHRRRCRETRPFPASSEYSTCHPVWSDTEPLLPAITPFRCSPFVPSLKAEAGGTLSGHTLLPSLCSVEIHS